MKNVLKYVIAIIVSLIITFVFFEIMSWYHFLDIPTKVVFIRLLAFFLIILGLILCIMSLVKKRNKK